MSFLISNAAAEGAATAPAGAPPWILLVFMLVLMVAMMYPQMRRAKKHREMMAALQKGDEVISSGGILGRITDISEDFLTVEVAPGSHIKLQKNAVSAVMPKGTIKNA